MPAVARITVVLVLLTFYSLTTARAEDTVPASALIAEQGPAVVERAIRFLVDDAAKWRSTRGCSTCHHGVMSVWALTEAKTRGYAVPAEDLSQIAKWTKDLFVPQFSKPRDPRWGYNFVSLPGIYLAVMSHSLPVLSRDEMHRMAIHLARHQEDDGVWAVPPHNPNTSPPTWESPETIALLALLAWEPYFPANPQTIAANRAARERAIEWLDKTKPTETNQALSLRLLLDIRSGIPVNQLQSKIDSLLKRQNADGGWSQLPELPSDAYATGQTLWILSNAGLNSDHASISRGLAFLISTQQDNGAWPMTPRTLPKADPARPRNPVPITYFGTAWATLALVRYVPPALDVTTAEKQAHDYIRTLSGSFVTEGAGTDNAALAVKFSYEVDDQQVAEMSRLLKPLPQLRTLQFKSPAITDAGTVALKALTQLRSLSLELAPITDAGLANLHALTNLEELNLTGTKVTDAGVAELQRALPKTKLQR